jgi:hypothetical protein
MKAPKKIYLHPTAKGEVGASWLTFPLTDEDVEYVRTDALIERALAFIRSCTTYDGLGYKAKCVNIEDFKNYMKGE